MSRKISAKRIRQALHYNPETGIFTRKVDPAVSAKTNARYAGKPAGCSNKNGYIFISVDRTRYYGHRLAWVYMTGKWPKAEVDHKNGKRADNRWQNLRDASQSQNRWNAKVRSDNTTGLKGVGHITGTKKWRATICVHGKSVYIGRFNSKDEAFAAYKNAAQQLHGAFANTGENHV